MKKNLIKFLKKYITGESIRLTLILVIAYLLVRNKISQGRIDYFEVFDFTILTSFILLLFLEAISTLLRGFINEKYEEYEKLKVDSNFLIRKYELANLYIATFNSCTYPIDLLALAKPGHNFIFEINDNPESYYQLPEQIKTNSDNLMSAHSSSKVYNQHNIRLRDINIIENKIILNTHRTYYFDSLITNRACDYQLSNGKSIREIFEPGPIISPLNMSKMSNHLGFNGFIISKDNKVILVKRSSRFLSIGRNSISSSIAASLKTKYALKGDDYRFTVEGLANAIRNEIEDELGLNVDYISDEEIIKSIFAFYRDLIEIGKPQFVFTLKINEYSGEILEIFENYIENRTSSKRSFDSVQSMLVDGEKLFLLSLNEIKESLIDPNTIKIIDKNREKKFNIQPSISSSLALFIDYMKF